MNVHTDPNSLAAFKDRFAEDPLCILDYPAAFIETIDPADLADAQLAIAQRKFAAAVEHIEMVRQLADRNEVKAITEFDDLIPVSYNHETFKSYPQSWLEAGDFKRLTRWLGKLCAADVSQVDASSCELIEDWMTVLKAQSSIDLQISAGADGKSAFMPRSHEEWALLQRLSLWGLQTAKDANGQSLAMRPGVDRVPLIYLGARRGARSMSRFLDFYEETFGEGLVDTLTEYNDSDLLSLAGRIKEASKKGEAGQVQINPQLLAQKDKIALINMDQPQRMEALMDRLLNDYRGKRIICQGTMQMFYDLAMRFRERGVKGAYTADSVFLSGSGFANGVEPPNWRADVAETFGIPETSVRMGYGMQEALWSAPLCSHDKYHLPLTMIPFVLDEINDQPLPRTGRQEGRFAFFNLLAGASWGGYMTGDHVTMTWDTCGCGRKGPHLDRAISKITDKQGDKVSCAGTADALEEATEFLLKS
jgi:hypothetical protein